MEIPNRAWHLRWVRFFTPGYMPKDLCRYFWVLVFHLTLVPLVYIPSWPLIWLCISLDRRWDTTSDTDPSIAYNGGTRVWFALIAPLVLLVLLKVAGDRLITPMVRARRAQQAKVPVRVKKLGFKAVLWEYLVAKKRRLCPLIIVKDE